VMSPAQAVYIDRTITMDGDMTDWYDTDANTYDPAGDITNNSGQYSEDLQTGTGDADEPITAAGRDLKKFSFTWDNTYLYFYVERYASSTSVTDWFFYIDSTTGGVSNTNPDGRLQSGEKIFRVTWQGNTRSTNAYLYDYVAVDTVNGDEIFGDGYTMPGSKTNEVSLYSTNYGSSSGTAMETILRWDNILGLTAPANIAFHISSATSHNIPTSVADNMDGPAGGQLFPRDLQITKTSLDTSVRGKSTITYEGSVYNSSIDPFTNVEITDTFPSQVTYTHPNWSATTGTFNGSVWSIPTIAANTTETLTLTVTANSVPVSIGSINTAELTGDATVLSEDDDNTNNLDTAIVTILPIPDLTIAKSTAGVSTASPGSILTYTITVANSGGEDGSVVVLTDKISPYEQLKVDYGGSSPFVFNLAGSGLTVSTLSYSSTAFPAWTHTLAVNPPFEFDSAVTEFRIEFSGVMTNTTGNFSVTYQTQVRP